MKKTVCLFAILWAFSAFSAFYDSLTEKTAAKNIPEGWGLYENAPSGQHGTISLFDTEGAQALLFSSANRDVSFGITRNFDVKPGSTVRVSVEAALPGEVNEQGAFFFLQLSMPQIAQNPFIELRPEGRQFKTFSQTLKVPPGVDHLAVYLYSLHGLTGKILLRNFRLEELDSTETIAPAKPVEAIRAPVEKVESMAGRQIELCMIGDSITWAGDGDDWRKVMLLEMPELAFVGTHTGKNGYAHAGEGGNGSNQVLCRIGDAGAVPNSRYYHLMVGINDCQVPSDADIPTRAEAIYQNIKQIVEGLLSKAVTEKVFVATVMPCLSSGYDDEIWQRRDRCGIALNQLLRRKLKADFPQKVTLIDYEQATRDLPDCKEIIRLHPTPAGYQVIGTLTAQTLKRETVLPSASEPAAGYGVEVVNLFADGESAPLIPGWYILSFAATPTGKPLDISLKSKGDVKPPLLKTWQVTAQPGHRVELEFFTGYDNYDYVRAPLVVEAANGVITEVMIEKMRPSRKASSYGRGSFIDSTSPMSPGEKLCPLR